MFKRAIVATLALAAGASAQLKILAPGGPDLWWVANSQNTLIWNCRESQFSNFTVLLTNTHQTVLTGPQAIIAVVNNFDCSRSITTQQANLPVSDGYRVQLANPINISEVYTESELFEVRAQGSAYPDPSSTPTASSGSSGTGTGGSPTQTGGANGDTNSAGILSTGSVLTGVVALVAGVVGAL